MRNFRSVDTVRLTLAAALGLSSFACGGRTTTASPVAAGSDGPQADDTGTAVPEGDAPAPEGGAVDGAAREAGPFEAVPDDGGRPFPCVDPMPLLIGGADTGYDTCRGDARRRRAIVDCPNLLPRASGGACPPSDAGVSDDAGYYGCRGDTDCTAHPFGTCYAGYQGTSCFCAYGCVRDSDCMSGQICECADPVGLCVPASCNAGTCGSGFDCADYTSSPGCPGKAFACQTSNDTCFSDSECDGGACSIPNSSGTAQTGSRACSGTQCAVGRPFLVAGEARLAPVTARGDWRAEAMAPAVASLSPQTRARLAARWLELAQMEHASIAAFARFSLQLLAVGAPPALVLAAQRAMADETRHAQMAFGLASAYSGRDLGPGPLTIDACLDATDRAALVATVFAEGCIGETLAAVEAREALEHVRDPAVREVLETIAADETRHAELAWRTLVWAADTGREEVRDGVTAAIAAALEQGCAAARAPSEGSQEALLAHGILSARMRRRLRHDALSEVVIPCARRLLARPRAGHRDVAPNTV